VNLPRRRLGATSLEVSALGLGTVKLGRNQGVKYPHHFELPDDKQAANLLSQAADLGINLLDTAPAYGSSEARLGALLGNRRSQWLICTKVGEEFEGGRSCFDFSPQYTRLSIERSLRRLNTDYLDIVLVHSDGNDIDIINRSGVIQVLQNLKTRGLIRAFGMSTKTLEGGLLAAEHCDCVMVTWNTDQQTEIPVVDRCHELNKGVLIKKIFASGNRVGVDQTNTARSIIAQVFGHPGVSCAVVGTINPDHLAANAALIAERLDHDT
jgi:aryl-alcohol dehydrogenase-like predicted oxidoreductase